MMASPMKIKRRRAAVGGQFRVLKQVGKPRMLLVVLLLFCWDRSNGSPSSDGHGNRARSSPSTHSHRPTPQHGNLFQLLYPQNQRFAQMLLEESPQARFGFQIAESPEDAVQHQGVDVEEEEKNALIGGIGNGEMVKPGAGDMKRRKKQDCGVPTVAVRSFMEPQLLKRSYFANTREDVEDKQRHEESTRLKREAATRLHKRNEIGTDGPLPWTCETKYEWEDKGADHYPRFVRTAECKSRFCFNGFFRCKPRRYKTKVLKRLTGTEVASCEEDDVSLPESLRSTWKFVTVTINLCCDCTSRVPGTDA